MIKLAAALLLCTLPAQAFVFIMNGGYNKGARPVANAPMWSGRTLTFYINTNQSIMGGSIAPELNTTQFQSAITSAVAAWNDSCGSNIRVVVAGTTTNTRSSGDSVNTIMWDNRTTGEGNYAADTDTLAFAAPAASGDTLVDCDMVVNGEATGNFAINGSAADYDLVGVMVHEIGHCLGLDHTVEPPTYTSNNTILLNAVMNSSIAAGDTSKRVLSQDESDSMECVYPSTSGYSARGGYYCTSYHGTSGGAALSGTVSGGPSSSRTCGEGQLASITRSTASGGGCISKAIAADGSPPVQSREIGWTLLFPLLSVLFFRKRIMRFFLSALVFISVQQPALAAIEVGYTFTRAKPAGVQAASELTTAEGNFASTISDPAKPFDSFADLYASLSFSDSTHSNWALYYKKGLSEKLAVTGKNSAGTVLVKKNSSLTAWLIGVARRYYILPENTRGLNGFLELQLAGGSATYNQKIEDSNSLTHTISGSAFVFETNAYLGAQFPLWGMLDGIIKAGYARMHSNYFSVNSVNGSRYGSIKSGDRIAVRSGQDLSLVRDGFSVQLALTYGMGKGSSGFSASAPTE